MREFNHDEFLDAINKGFSEINKLIGEEKEISIRRNDIEKIFKYRIIENEREAIDTLLHPQDDDHPCIVLCPIEIKGEIIKDAFSGELWFFLNSVDFSNTTFEGPVNFKYVTFCDRANFMESYFRQRADFTFSKFLRNAYFASSRFLEDTIFKFVNFKEESSFINSKFKGSTDFSYSSFGKKCEFDNSIFDGVFQMTLTHFHGNLGLKQAIFKERVDLRIEDINGTINLRNTSFRDEVILNLDCFFGSSKQPEHLFVYDEYGNFAYWGTKENIHSLKKICHDNELYEYENITYYWYKVFERKTRFYDLNKEYNKNKIPTVFPLLWGLIRIFFNFLILDKGSKYFTSPSRVFSLITIVLFVWFGIYSTVNLANQNENALGYLVHSTDIICETTIEDHVLKTTFKSDKTLMNECIQNEKLNIAKFIRYNAYFSLITFTTIGYGDIQPVGFMQIVAGIEGFLGVLLMSLFLVTSAKKVLW